MKHITSASVFSLLIIIILFSGCIGFPVYEQPVYILLVPNQQVQTVKVCDVSGWFCHSAYMIGARAPLYPRAGALSFLAVQLCDGDNSPESRRI